MKCLPILSTLVLSCLLAACGGQEAAPPVDEAAAQAQAASEPGPAEPEDRTFRISDVPVSDAPLGDFPYFTMPPGYHSTPKLSGDIEHAVFPFWIGDRYLAVEGRVHMANFRVDQSKKFSTLEVEAYIEDMMASAGATKLFEGEIPRDESARVLTRDFTSTFANGLCWPKEPVRTYVVHRTDRAIWVHACSYGGIGAAWVIVEDERVAPATGTAMGSEELRKRIDADGRVDLAVHFESDSSRMMSGSQQQISEIVEMMQADADLALSVNGYTDNSGTAQRNLELSRERAHAIVDELVRRGIPAARLRAHGFGRERPVADNATAEGRAKNRRVELERI